MKAKFAKIAAAVALSACTFGAFAAETAIGEPKQAGGIEFAAVYLQPITMDKVMGLPAAKSDIHLELDVKATKDNPNGFGEDTWVPYLVVSYELQKLDKDGKASGPANKGDMMAMVANDGPHYGENIKLQGPGKYKVKFTVLPPSENKKEMFARHIDKETGVGEWFKPINLEWTFDWAGTGKKGGY